MAEFPSRRRRSPLSHPSSVDFGSDTASDISSWTKGPSFATPDNLQAATIQLQSTLRSFGFSGRINFLSGSPDEIANILNCVHNLLQRLQHEQYLKEDAQTGHRRLRMEAQTYEQNLTRLRKEIEINERDIATLQIKGRQEADRHAEELTAMLRERDTLQKHSNNLTRRQIQFQHEIRRKELQYEWLQEKLRNYLAERKKESSASMEIVGRLCQTDPRHRRERSKEKSKLGAKIDDMMPGRNGNAKKAASRGPKLDETMVKMIVTAYEEKQKELMTENKDLQEALNSIRKEYADLMNAQMEMAESSSRALSRVNSKTHTTKRDGRESQESNEEPSILPPHHEPTKELPHEPRTLPPHDPSTQPPYHDRSSHTATSFSFPTAADLTTADVSFRTLVVAEHSGRLYDAPEEELKEPPAEDIRRIPEIPDGVLNANHPDLVPWPIDHDVSLRSIEYEGESREEQAILDTAEHAPVLPTVSEEQEIPESTKGTPRDAEPEKTEEQPIDADVLAEQSDLVVNSLRAASEEKQPVENITVEAEISAKTEDVQPSQEPPSSDAVEPPTTEPPTTEDEKPVEDASLEEDNSPTTEDPQPSETGASDADASPAACEQKPTDILVPDEDAVPVTEDPSPSETADIAEDRPPMEEELKQKRSASADEVSEDVREKMSRPRRMSRKSLSEFQGSSADGSPTKIHSRSQKFVWPPPSTSPPREDIPRRRAPALGKLPQPSNKPVPNAALLSEEQLKTELRTRAGDVEEAVRALKTACTSMQPENMRSVMEKRLHMELTMAANLAEQQEAVVNLALAGLEKVRRTAPGSEAELEEIASTVISSLKKTESVVTEMTEMLSSGATADQLSHGLNEIMKEIQDLREKMANRESAILKEGSVTKSVSEDLERSILTLRERADSLMTKEKELINKARGDLTEEKLKDPPSRRTWAEKAEDEKELMEANDLSPDVYSDDEGPPSATLSRILHSTD